MKFDTKLWQRSEKSYAATIPQAAVFMLDPSKKYYVEWSYDQKTKRWHIEFVESKISKTMISNTSLWKRSQRSYATTIPHAVILHIDEEKLYKVEWEYDTISQKWMLNILEVKK